jgi:hypothetical protein
LLEPNQEKSAPWVISMATRSLYDEKYYAVIVPIEYEDVNEQVNS